MKKFRWELKLAFILTLMSFVIYYIDFRLFGTAAKIYDSILNQIAFLPIYVLFVTMVLEQILYKKEKQNMISKMNVVIGVFFSEIGRELLQVILSYDKLSEKNLLFADDMYDKKYKTYIKKIISYKPQIKAESSELEILRLFMEDKKQFLHQMMHNPNLLEHESFTELMLSVFHLMEELNLRQDFNKEEDLKHLNTDIERVYSRLIRERFFYLKHLKEEYPYLYSMELRINPFKKN